MDSSQLASEVRDWLQESGVMREMQTRLRAKMIDRIMIKGGGKLKGGEKVESECTERQRAINSLILEHLLRRRQGRRDGITFESYI
jgi:hypothetical protein